MDKRKRITAILVALIVIIPVVAVTYYFMGPSRFEELSIGDIAPDDTDRRGVYIIGSAIVGGRSYSGDAELKIFDDDLQKVYEGKVTFDKNLLNHYLELEQFATGNGRYEFRISQGGKTARFYYELDMVVEELQVFATATWDTNTQGLQPYQCAYSYTTTFMTGWHWWTETVDGKSFYTWNLGYIGKGNTTTFKVETPADASLNAQVVYRNPDGTQDIVSTTQLPTLQEYTGTIQHTQDGTYWINIHNDRVDDVDVKVYQNRNTRTPRPQNVEFDFKLGGQNTTFSVVAAKTEAVSGYLRPKLAAGGKMLPGNYTVTARYDQTTVLDSSPYRTVTNVQTVLLNDRPVADTKAGEPYSLSTLPPKRSLTLNATRSFDDGPMDDVYVYWFWGATSSGLSLGESEGPWEDHKTITVVYTTEFPDPVNGRPYLIITDGFGKDSEIAYVNVQVG